MRILDGHAGRVRGLAYTPDGSTLASCGDDGMVRLWDRESGRPIRALAGSLGEQGYRKGVYGVAISPGGRWLASAGGDRCIRLWDPATIRAPIVLEGHSGVVTSVAFLDDQTLYSGGGNALGQVAAWRIGGPAPRMIALQSRGIWCIAVDPHRGPEAPGPDPVALGTAGTFSDELGVFFWNPGSDPYPGPATARVRSLAYSPDGRTLAASQKDEVVIWDLKNPLSRWTLRGHTDIVFGLALSPSGSELATASGDGTVRIWEPDSGRERACYDWGIGKVGAVAFAPDGMTLAAGGEGGIVVSDVEST